MARSRLYCCIVMAFCAWRPWHAAAQTYDSAAGTVPLTVRITDDLRASLHDAGATASAPPQWGKGSWLCAGISAGALAGAFAMDTRVRHWVQSDTSPAADRFMTPWQYWGDGAVAGSGAGALYLSGLFFSNDWLRETGRSALTALALTGIATTVLKVAAGRSRPYVGNGPDRFSFFRTADADWSFPSGHIATAFALSSVLASRIDNVYVAVPLYCVAALTATERLYADQHWFSDVCLGGLIGTTIGNYIGRRSRKQHRNHIGTLRFEIEPTTDGQSVGVAASVRY